MRITNGIIQRTALANLQLNMRGMFEAQEAASSGKRIRAVSNDPIGASQVMQASGSLRALDQYKRNIGSATARVNAEESALDSLTRILERAKEIGITQAVSSASATTRAAGKSELDQLLASAVQLGNQQHEGEYLFGGISNRRRRFSQRARLSRRYRPRADVRPEISQSQFLLTNHNGTEVFLDTNVLAALNQRVHGARHERRSASRIRSRGSRRSRLGAEPHRRRWRALQSARGHERNLTALDTQLRTFKSALEDADTEKAVTELVSRQNTYQAAMLAASRVMSLNLASYLQ